METGDCRTAVTESAVANEEQKDMNTARDLAIASLTRVKARDRDGWLALFEDDGTIEDPVGPSPFSPDGRGQRGKKEITAFYDNVISTVGMDWKIHKSFLC